MIIRQIRNATLKITYAGYTFLTDHWLSDKGTGFSARTVIPEMAGLKNPLCDLPDTPENILEGVDFCLVSHVHPDHISTDYMPLSMRMIAQDEEDYGKLREMGFTCTQTFENDELSIGSIRIRRTEGIHGDNPDLIERMGKVSGFVLEAPDEKPLYIAGDTVYYEGVRETIERYRPEVIILNSCAATTPRGRLIMNADDLGMVCADAPYATVIASHMESVNHATLSRADIKAYADAHGLAQVLIPADGETIRL